MELPKTYKDSYREIFNADACTVDMHKLGPHFYELGCYVAKHDIKGEVGSTLISVSNYFINLDTSYLVSCNKRLEFFSLPLRNECFYEVLNSIGSIYSQGL